MSYKIHRVLARLGTQKGESHQVHRAGMLDGNITNKNMEKSMAELISEVSHTSLSLTRQEASEIIAMLAKDLAENNSQSIVLPLGLNDESESLIKKNVK